MKHLNRTDYRFTAVLFRTVNRWAAFEFLFAPVKLLKRSELNKKSETKWNTKCEMSFKITFAEVNVEDFPSKGQPRSPEVIVRILQLFDFKANFCFV